MSTPGNIRSIVKNNSLKRAKGIATLNEKTFPMILAKSSLETQRFCAATCYLLPATLTVFSCSTTSCTKHRNDIKISLWEFLEFSNRQRAKIRFRSVNVGAKTGKKFKKEPNALLRTPITFKKHNNGILINCANKTIFHHITRNTNGVKLDAVGDNGSPHNSSKKSKTIAT